MNPANRQMFVAILRGMRSQLDTMEQIILLSEAEGGERKAPPVDIKRDSTNGAAFTTQAEDEALAEIFGLDNPKADETHESLLGKFFEQIRSEAGHTSDA